MSMSSGEATPTIGSSTPKDRFVFLLCFAALSTGLPASSITGTGNVGLAKEPFFSDRLSRTPSTLDDEYQTEVQICDTNIPVCRASPQPPLAPVPLSEQELPCLATPHVSNPTLSQVPSSFRLPCLASAASIFFSSTNLTQTRFPGTDKKNHMDLCLVEAVPSRNSPNTIKQWYSRL